MIWTVLGVLAFVVLAFGPRLEGLGDVRVVNAFICGVAVGFIIAGAAISKITKKGE